MYDWVLNTPLGGFRQDDQREELAIAPVVECLQATAYIYITIKLAVSRTTDTFLKTRIFVDVFLIEEYEHAALRKKLLIAHRAL